MANENKNEQGEENFNNSAVSGTSGAPDIETIVQAASEEYQNIDRTLDEIDSWMTKLEEQNDNLFSELEQFLESSRQARLELQQQQDQELSEHPQDGQNEDTCKEGGS